MAQIHDARALAADPDKAEGPIAPKLEGLAHLERTVRLEDGLRYNEPPDWYFPVRHFLGAMLLDSGRPNEAELRK